ncbi:MAG: insulinase family protein [Kiritimatiellae bacterium]|nr:insulinase family protein [Kiritimatiellia bacterium]
MIAEIAAVMFGFKVESITNVPDVNGRLWRMTYEKNGAELVWLERDDEVKTFVIAFKTLPEDDTGVAHILEHSVLAGSEKYPVKSPFDEMRKSSVRVFMNAMTARDVTFYPFSTRNDKDFLNLADVYLDAVFHPLSIRNPLPFRQEGWHYELDAKTKNLSVNGVVFNEMKGVYALPDSIAYRELICALYPDVVYGHDSGGKPENIPDLTYEKYRAFHRRFYHPSNARIFLDGRIEINDILKKLDAVLSPYDRLEVNAHIGLQAPVSRSLRLPYESANCDHKTIFVLGWSVGTITDDPAYIHALDILVEYLCGSNEAPLKKALLKKHLCKDVSMGNIEYKQIPLYLILKDTSDEQLDECRKVVRETLEKIATEGFDKDRLGAIINRDEFSERELNTSRPKGLHYFSRVLRQWLYGRDPLPTLNLTETYRRLREGVTDGWFEKIVREQILASGHKIEVVLTPDAGLTKVKADKVKRALQQKRDAMSAEDLAGIASEVQRLKEYQSRPDTKEDIEKIPRLTSKELAPKGIPSYGKMKEVDGTTYIQTKSSADGVFYLTFYFPMDGFEESELLGMPLFARLHGKLRTSKHSAFELQTLVAANIGRLFYSTVSTERGRYFKVTMAGLTGKAQTALDLLYEILFETRFDDTREIETILRQKQLDAERNVSGDGRELGLRVTKRTFSERWASADVLQGEKQLRWLQNAKADERMSKFYQGIGERLFTKDGLVVSFTDNLPLDMEAVVRKEFNQGKQPKVNIAIAEPTEQAFSIAGDTSFAVWSAELPAGVRLTGPMRVACKILSLEYLHREVREIGGAYGIMIQATANGTIDGYSYRDPNPVRTIQTISKVGEALRKFVNSGADLDRYIVSTIAAMEPYRPPAEEAARAAEMHTERWSNEDEDRIRAEVLSTTKEQLLEVATMLDTIAPKAKTCIVGGAKQLSNVKAKTVVPVVPKDTK